MDHVQGAPEGAGNLDSLYERARILAFQFLLEESIETEDELHAFIEAYIGYDVPRQSFCPDHVAPFTFIADQFFEKSNSVIGFANRTGGKTLNVSILNVLESIFKPDIEILSAGAVRTQAEKGYEYVLEHFGNDHLLEFQLQKTLKDQLLLKNKAKVGLTTAGYAGFNSPHPEKLRLDEIELITWSFIQEALSMSQSRGKWAAGDCFTSTRKVAHHTMQRMLDEADKRGFKVYQWCIFETLEKCTRECKGDDTYGDCPAYSYKDSMANEQMLCGGKAHHVPGGFYKIRDFIKKVQNLDRDTFESQWLNLKPDTGGLVYGKYYADSAPWLVDTDEEEEILKRAQDHGHWQRVVGIDYGSNFAAIFAMKDPHDDTWYAYNEYWYSEKFDRTTPEHAKLIRQSDPLGWTRRSMVWGDPSARQAIHDMRRLDADSRIYVRRANNDLYMGIDYVKVLLQQRHQTDPPPSLPSYTPGTQTLEITLDTGEENAVLHHLHGWPQLRVFSRCERLRKEMSEMYKYGRDRKTDEILKDQVVKDGDHMCDALRYALYSYRTQGGRVRGKRLRGVW